MRERRLKDLRVLAGLWVALLSPLDVSIAQAQTFTTHVGVDVTIGPNCIVQSTAVDFGSYDPLVVNVSSPLNGTGVLTVKCTKTANATIMLGQGSHPSGTSTDSAPERRISNGGGAFLSYFLFQDSSRTAPWGNTAATGVVHMGIGFDVILPVYGQIPGGQSAPGGLYEDTVIADVTF
jgi:spore coat protein U-like protein